jgi:hypothetical protein
MVMVSVNPGTASSSGIRNPTVSVTVVVVVVARRVVDVVSRIGVVVDVAGCVAEDSTGVGDRSSHPSRNAAAASAPNRNQPVQPIRGGVGWNSGSILT